MKIDFIENKKINFNQFKKIYSVSIKKNSHANFGPVYLELCKKFKKLVKLPKNNDCLFCSSGTIALLTAVNFFRKKNEGKMITSNYTFFSSNVSYLDKINILDTDNFGILTGEILKNNFNKSWSTLIFTNLFNQNPGLKEIYNFIYKKKIDLVVDNSNNILDRPKFYNKMKLVEIISFHHTKPWGYGEGGVIIFDKKYKNEFCNLINFGAKNFSKNKKYSLNGKISDISCAAILQRLNNFSIWSKQYLVQKIRILKIIKTNFKNYKILHNFKNKSPINYLPIILHKKITSNDLKKTKYLTLRKYYIPLNKNKKKFKNSIKLFNNILCIPCHKDIKNLKDREIKADLKKFFN